MDVIHWRQSIMHGMLHSGPTSPQPNQVTGAQLSQSARIDGLLLGRSEHRLKTCLGNLALVSWLFENLRLGQCWEMRSRGSRAYLCNPGSMGIHAFLHLWHSQADLGADQDRNECFLYILSKVRDHEGLLAVVAM